MDEQGDGLKTASETAAANIKVNRMLSTYAGTVLWVVLLGNTLPGFDTGHALFLAVWIGLGSTYYSKTLKEFGQPITLKILLGLALLAPAWPLLHWNAGKPS